MSKTLECNGIIIWNNKNQEIIIKINRYNIDISALSEIKKKEKKALGNYILLYSEVEKNYRLVASIEILVYQKFENIIKY